VADRRLSVRIDFASGGTLKTDLDGYKGRVESLSRFTRAAQKDAEKLFEIQKKLDDLGSRPPQPVQQWLEGREASAPLLQARRSFMAKATGRFGGDMDESRQLAGGAAANPFDRLEQGVDAMISRTQRLTAAQREYNAELAKSRDAATHRFSSFNEISENLLDQKMQGWMSRKTPPEASEQATSFDAMRNQLQRRAKVAGHTPGEVAIMDLEGKLNPDQLRELGRLNAQAEEKEKLAAHAQAEKMRKGPFSGKRVFAGAGFGILSLASTELFSSAPDIGKGVGFASAGAGIATALGAPSHVVGVTAGATAAIGLVFGHLKESIEHLFPSAERLRTVLGEIGDSMVSTARVGYETRFGAGPGAAAFAMLPGDVKASIASAVEAGGGLGTGGGERGGLRAIRSSVEMLHGFGGEDLLSDEIGKAFLTAVHGAKAEAAFAAMSRFRTGVGALEEAGRRGGIDDVTRRVPEISGIGEVPSITDSIISGLMREPIRTELTDDTIRGLGRAVAEAAMRAARGDPPLGGM
jgi:hypothetical protein